MKNVVSIDLEEWFHRPIVKPYIENVKVESNIEKSVEAILEVFSRYNKQTTFFILGEILDKYPGLVEKINEKDHEIAFHGDSHKSLHDLDKKTFIEELKKGKKSIQKVTGEPPQGFRAPVFSLTKDTSWSLTILQKQGFRYDSSIVPAWSPMYGNTKAPTRIYYPDFDNPSKESSTQRDLIEFPLAIAQILGFRIPFAGGFYQRVLGNNLFLMNIKRINKKNPAMLYFHPWELCGFQKIAMPYHKKIFAYYRTKSLKKLEHIIKTLDITTAREILSKN